MSDHLGDNYCTISVRGSTSAYFVSVAEGQALDGFLSRRDDMGREDRADFCRFQELNGRWTRLSVDEIESICLSTPAIRAALNEVNAELKARAIADGDL